MSERLISDVGGLPSGPVPREEVPQLYWEKAMIAMFNVLIAKGLVNLDEFRRAVEQMTPDHYAGASFYGRRVDGVAALLVEKGILDGVELERRALAILTAGTRDHVA
ncbi:SH3-like domain-containing protein [Aquabacter cavernae]|uniref:SH3-like domain-containing protein n=1 Tax=Aquabacter cavernae TaxID=2496029 RepID=UPI000F8D4984|nr:SH3-like domain-containing protein [Aquabacter cavernae]